MVLDCLDKAFGGEIFVPKIPSYRIVDVAKAIAPNWDFKNIGIRPGEKIHEEIITTADSPNTLDIGSNYVIMPNKNYIKEKYKEHNILFKKVAEGFSYNSFNNPNFLTIDEIRNLIREHIDPTFEVV